jgi:hypothetical protein
LRVSAATGADSLFPQHPALARPRGVIRICTDTKINVVVKPARLSIAMKDIRERSRDAANVSPASAAQQ